MEDQPRNGTRPEPRDRIQLDAPRANECERPRERFLERCMEGTVETLLARASMGSRLSGANRRQQAEFQECTSFELTSIQHKATIILEEIG